jgi:pimeloyl-ACP methyl ester carboxylesterase
MKRTLRWLLALVAIALLALLLWPEAPAGPTGAWLRAAGLEPRFDTVEGLRVRYVRAGDGPAVVLLHGFASSIYTWKDVLPGLARSRSVVALDLPGFGESDRPSDLSFESYPRIVLGLMDHLGIAQATLVGNSMGGALATVVAGQTPGRVRGLVLIDAAGFNLEESERPFLVRLAGSRIGGRLADRLPVRGKLLRVGLHQIFHDPALITEERYNEYLAPLLRPGSTQAILSLLHSRTLEPRLVVELAGKVKAPTLVLWGREDRWIPVEQADRFVAAISGARKVVFEDCGHMPQEERPADVLRWLQEFPEDGSAE